MASAAPAKQLVARAIHAASLRRGRSFVKIDCAAPAQALETELFGCDRGSAAGAGQHRPGRLEFAHHGTLFLDHVNELPAALQLRLQRALEDGGFARPGAHDAVHADVRVIASSERDLERAVVEGRFREGLFFRLNVVCLTLPPLRQRRSELRELAEFFVRRYAMHFNKPERPLSDDTLRLFVELQLAGQPAGARSGRQTHRHAGQRGVGAGGTGVRRCERPAGRCPDPSDEVGASRSDGRRLDAAATLPASAADAVSRKSPARRRTAPSAS